MANGDVTKVAALGRFLLPGGGNTTTGKQVQNKTLTWGEITCTAVDTGINIGAAGSVGAFGADWPEALGLERIDAIEFNAKTVGGQAIANDKLYFFDVSHSTWLIHHLEDVGQSNAALITAGDALVLTFWAIGDNANAAELT